ncbi:hypothetical protein HDV01_002944 [Terramyces sp. JEL0728]|nr:hypothetical protein HDV01_002944 [Terramyces sp. JEL0728]
MEFTVKIPNWKNPVIPKATSRPRKFENKMEVFTDQYPNRISITNNYVKPIQVSLLSSSAVETLNSGQTHQWKVDEWDLVIIANEDWKTESIGVGGKLGVYVEAGSIVFFNDPIISMPNNVKILKGKESRVTVNNKTADVVKVWLTSWSQGASIETKLNGNHSEVFKRNGPEFIVIKDAKRAKFGFLVAPGSEILISDEIDIDERKLKRAPSKLFRIFKSAFSIR